MKSYFTLIASVMIFQLAVAQNTFPTPSGNVGIGTTSPNGLLSTGSILKNKKILLYDDGTEAAGFGMFNYETRMFSPSSSTNHISFGKYTASTDLFEEHMRIENEGNVAIGTKDAKGHKLAVNGTIIATEMTIQVYPWSDYVFHPEYRLRPLSEVESFILTYHHLPEVPSAAEVATNGVKVGETEALLLKKIEELTLYLIEKDKELQAVKQQLAAQQTQQQQIDALKHQVELLAEKIDKK